MECLPKEKIEFTCFQSIVCIKNMSSEVTQSWSPGPQQTIFLTNRNHFRSLHHVSIEKLVKSVREHSGKNFYWYKFFMAKHEIKGPCRTPRMLWVTRSLWSCLKDYGMSNQRENWIHMLLVNRVHEEYESGGNTIMESRATTDDLSD